MMTMMITFNNKVGFIVIPSIYRYTMAQNNVLLWSSTQTAGDRGRVKAKMAVSIGYGWLRLHAPSHVLDCFDQSFGSATRGSRWPVSPLGTQGATGPVAIF